MHIINVDYLFEQPSNTTGDDILLTIPIIEKVV